MRLTSPRWGIQRPCLVTGLALAAILICAQVASAATLSYDSGSHTLTFAAAAGENNGVTIAQTGANAVEVIENDLPSITIDGTASNCSAPDSSAPYIVDCTNVNAVVGNLGDGNDGWYADESGTQFTLPETVNAGDGADSVQTGSGADTIDGGTGNDFLDGGAGADTLTGGSGADELDDTDTSNGDTLSGGDDGDYFYMGSSADGTGTVTGGAGSDAIDYSSRSAGVTVDLQTTLTGGQTGAASDTDQLSGIESVYGSYSGANVLTGDDNANELDGGTGADVINGNGGDDSIWGDDANDLLNGGAGNDSINAGNGNDTVNGGDGSDEIYGGDGADIINANAGDDYVDPGFHDNLGHVGSDGSDAIDGGDGSDTIDYGSRTAPVTIDLRGVTGQPTTSNGESSENDSLANFENAYGGSAGDAITGNDGPNQLYDGGGSSDIVQGLGGDDMIGTYDGAVDNADCGDGKDSIDADSVAYDSSGVDDVLTNCEIIDGFDTTAPPPPPPPTTTSTSTSTPPATPGASLPQTGAGIITVGAFFAKIQQSPKANSVFGSANIPADGTALEVDLFYNGKLAKLTTVGRLVKKGLKKGVYPFTVKLNKKATKLAKKKGKKGLKLTIKVTIKAPGAKAFVKTGKVTVRKGKASACRVAQGASGVQAHIAC